MQAQKEMEKLKKFMKKQFGLSEFKSEDQERALQVIIENKNIKNDFIISMATQAGKSLIFQLLGGIKKSGVTVIITPSIALANDQVYFLKKFDLGATSIDHNITYDERRDILKDLINNCSDLKFLFFTPEMLKSDFRTPCGRRFLQYLFEEELVNYIIIDEAHKVIDSRKFRSAFKEIKHYKDEDTKWIALTSGGDNIIQEIAAKLSMKSPFKFKSSLNRKNIFYDARIAQNYSTLAKDIKLLSTSDDNGDEIPSGIIFCQFYEDVVQLKKFLNDQNITANCYYGDMTYKDRKKIVKNWAAGVFSVLVATSESFGFGISHNVPTIRFVYHWAAPKNLRALYQVYRIRN
jgi:superfamily II DNA helicase RecQ